MILTLILTGVVLFLLLYALMPVWLLAACVAVAVGLLYFYHRGHRHSHGSFLSIDAYAQRSRLRNVSPGFKLAAVAVLIIFSVAVDSLPVCLAVTATMFLLTVCLGGTPPGYYLSLLVVPLAFVVLGGLAVLIQFSAAPLDLLDIGGLGGHVGITAQSQETARYLTAKAFAGLSCLYMLGLTTPMGDLIATLRRIRLPAVLIELMYLIYRYIFFLFKVQNSMSEAASSRLGYKNGRSTLKSASLIASGVLRISFRQASANFDAMEARCYDGSLRFMESRKRLRAGEIVVFAIYMGLLVLLWRLVM